MTEFVYMLVSLAAGIALGYGLVLIAMRSGENISKLINAINRRRPTVTALATLIVANLVAVAAHAQTPAPSNPSITIPTNVIFTETNTWIGVFAPIAAIGIGITLALAVLGYIAKMIAGAFR